MLNKTMKFEDIITFTRNSTATYWDKDGVLRTAAIDDPRFDHDPDTGEPLGILIEEQRTNYVWPSRFNTAAGIDFTEVIGPDRFPVVYRLQNNSGSDALVQIDAGTGRSGNNQHFITFAVKPETGVGAACVRTIGTTGSSIYTVRVDLETGEFSDGERARLHSFKKFDDGWRLIVVEVPDGLPGEYSAAVLTVHPSFAAAGADGTGLSPDGTSALIAAFQYEEGSFPTSYIPTSGAAATRAVENCNRTMSTEFNPAGFTIYSESVIAGDLEFGTPSGVTDGTANNRIGAFYAGGPEPAGVFRLLVGNEGTADFMKTPDTGLRRGDVARIAFSYEGDQLSFAVNGTVYNSSVSADGVDTSLFTTLALSSIGGSFMGSVYRGCEIYGYAMTDAELEALTV